MFGWLGRGDVWRGRRKVARGSSRVGQAASSRRSRPAKRPSMTPSRRDVRSVSDWTSLRRSPKSASDFCKVATVLEQCRHGLPREMSASRRWLSARRALDVGAGCRARRAWLSARASGLKVSMRPITVRAHSQDANELRCHGRLLGDRLRIESARVDLNGSTTCGTWDTWTAWSGRQGGVQLQRSQIELASGPFRRSSWRSTGAACSEVADEEALDAGHADG